VKEIDQAIEKVENSTKKLQEVREILLQAQALNYSTDAKEIKTLLEKAKIQFHTIELDMESEELEVRRMIFEDELKFFFADESQKLKYEEFCDFDKEYERLRNSLKDYALQG